MQAAARGVDAPERMGRGGRDPERIAHTKDNQSTLFIYIARSLFCTHYLLLINRRSLARG